MSGIQIAFVAAYLPLISLTFDAQPSWCVGMKNKWIIEASLGLPTSTIDTTTATTESRSRWRRGQATGEPRAPRAKAKNERKTETGGRSGHRKTTSLWPRTVLWPDSYFSSTWNKVLPRLIYLNLHPWLGFAGTYHIGQMICMDWGGPSVFFVMLHVANLVLLWRDLSKVISGVVIVIDCVSWKEKREWREEKQAKLLSSAYHGPCFGTRVVLRLGCWYWFPLVTTKGTKQVVRAMCFH